MRCRSYACMSIVFLIVWTFVLAIPLKSADISSKVPTDVTKDVGKSSGLKGIGVAISHVPDHVKNVLSAISDFFSGAISSLGNALRNMFRFGR